MADVALFQLSTGRAALSAEVVARLSAAESYSPSRGRKRSGYIVMGVMLGMPPLVTMKVSHMPNSAWRLTAHTSA